MIDVCADCGSSMGAFVCPDCGGITSQITLDALDDDAAMRLLEQASVLIDDGARIIEVQELRIHALERQIEGMRIESSKSKPTDAF